MANPQIAPAQPAQTAPTETKREVKVTIGTFTYSVVWSQPNWVIYYGETGAQPQLYKQTYKDFGTAFATVGTTLANEFSGAAASPSAAVPNAAPAAPSAAPANAAPTRESTADFLRRMKTALKS